MHYTRFAPGLPLGFKLPHRRAFVQRPQGGLYWSPEYLCVEEIRFVPYVAAPPHGPIGAIVRIRSRGESFGPVDGWSINAWSRCRCLGILAAEGQSSAIDQVFQAVHRNDPDPKVLAYQYLQMLPQLAHGDSNTFWVIPSEFTAALDGVTRAFSQALPRSPAAVEATVPERLPASAAQDLAQAADAVNEALTAAAQAERSPAVLAPTVGHNGSPARF